jgi:hypothetical protein
MSDVEIAAPEVAPVIEPVAPSGDKLDQIISESFKDYDDGSAPPPAAAPEEAPKDTRARDEHGRFVSAEAKAPEGAAEVTAPVENAPVEPAKPFDAPAHFTAEQKAQFATLAPEAQKIWVEVEKAREAEYTRRSQEHAEYKRTADPWVEAVLPYQKYLAHIAPGLGETPQTLVRKIIATEYQLRNAPPAQRYQAFAQLAQAYGVDLAALTSGQIPVQHQPQQPSYDPRLNAIVNEVRSLKQEREQNAALQKIAEFANTKDETGQAKYPHFERVKAVMGSLIDAGQAKTMEDAYTMAVKPFQDMIDSELAKRTQAQEAEKQAALEKARKAAPVRTSTGALPNGKVEAKGLDAHITRAMEKMGI